MGNRLYLALSLAAVPLFAARGASGASHTAPVETRGQGAETPGMYTATDAAYVEAMKSVQQLQNCKKLARQMSAGAAEKEAALKAEFGGRIPQQFAELLRNRRRRANKQESFCVTQEEAPAKLFAIAHQTLKQIQPYSLPGVAPRKKRLEKARAAYNQLVSADKEQPSEKEQSSDKEQQ